MAEITRICQDETIQRWTTVPSPYRSSDAESFVGETVPAGWSTGSSLTWAIRIAPTTAVVGMINIFDIRHGEGEIGFWLSTGHRGIGIMNEAVTVVCDYGFATDGLALRRIQWCAYVGNLASAAVARRAGFRYEGLQRLGGYQRGTRRDIWVAGLLASDDRAPGDGWPS